MLMLRNYYIEKHRNAFFLKEAASQQAVLTQNLRTVIVKIKLLLPQSKCLADPFDYLSSRIIAPAFSIGLI